ncbi:K-box region and MADS-box transcription factor family protein [Striga asiatica]|uniref:K-box region and MADS-box transcription factor family protein n=1 Tax=Striga asiatica TaxID=4170 RepID=A0A5A7RBN2_STRAF|nr:K-box region and MADS-box transcription factor family protein [Striga asiatica]
MASALQLLLQIPNPSHQIGPQILYTPEKGAFQIFVRCVRAKEFGDHEKLSNFSISFIALQGIDGLHTKILNYITIEISVRELAPDRVSQITGECLKDKLKSRELRRWQEEVKRIIKSVLPASSHAVEGEEFEGVREKRKRRESSRYYRTTSRCASTAGSQNHASAAPRILCQKCFNSVKSRAAAVDRSFRSSPPARFSMEGRLDFPPVSGDPEKEASVESAA